MLVRLLARLRAGAVLLLLVVGHEGCRWRRGVATTGTHPQVASRPVPAAVLRRLAGAAAAALRKLLLLQGAEVLAACRVAVRHLVLVVLLVVVVVGRGVGV